MTLVGIGVLLVGMAALVAAITYAAETRKWARSRTWWEPPGESSQTLATRRLASSSDDAPSVSELLRAYDPDNPLDGQVFD